MSKTKVPRADALRVAAELMEILRPVTMPDRLMVCGSLRREKDLVSDVELLFVPTVDQVPDGFFDKKIIDLAAEALDALLAKGVITKRPNVNGHFCWGAKNRLAIHQASGIAVDFFSVPEDHWWVSVVIRTGSADFNVLKMIAGAKRRGLKLHAYGAFEDAAGKTIVPKDEHEVFSLCGVPWAEPKDRSV